MIVLIYSLLIFILLKRSLSYKRNPIKSEEELKNELIKSMFEREVLENSELIQIAENVVKLEDAETCVKKDEKLLRSEKHKKTL